MAPSLLLGSLRAGSQGSVSALANLRPDLIVALVRAFAENDDEEAERLHEEIAAFERDVTALAVLKRAVADARADPRRALSGLDSSAARPRLDLPHPGY